MSGLLSRTALEGRPRGRRVRAASAPARRLAPFYDARERAALTWCEELAALTLMSEQGTADSPAIAIVTFNGWSRWAPSMRAPMGDSVSPHARRAIARRRADA
jgi:hypothetical protein